MENLLVSSLQGLAQSYQNAVDGARKEFEASTDIHLFLQYVEGPFKMSRLFVVAVHGQAECMKKLKVSNRAEIEKLWSEHLDNPGVKEAVDAFMDAERNWVELVKEVDRKLAIEEDKVTPNSAAHVGQQLPKSLSILDGSSGHPVNLETIWKESMYTLFMYVRHMG